LLPSLAVATALAAEGVRAVNLGPNTPLNVMFKAAQRHRAALVWVSLSAVDNLGGLSAELDRLANSLGESGAMLVVGGRSSRDIALPEAPHVRAAETMSELAEIGQRLCAHRQGAEST
jgi:methylmalonyl-CoA mutase cobalamin-binding subunit